MNKGDHTHLIYDRPTHDRIELFLPVTVIENTVERSAVYLCAGTPVLSYTTPADAPVSRDIPYREFAALHRDLRETTWKNTNVLICWQPEWSWDVRLMWDAATWNFLGWYLNIQTPIQPVEGGFRTTDHFLDVVVAPNGDRKLKDEAELEDAVDLGMYTKSEHAQTTFRQARD